VRILRADGAVVVLEAVAFGQAAALWIGHAAVRNILGELLRADTGSALQRGHDGFRLGQQRGIGLRGPCEVFADNVLPHVGGIDVIKHDARVGSCLNSWAV